jgi:hypothetical protein
MLPRVSFQKLALALIWGNAVGATKFSEYILAPNYRSVTPLALYAVNGAVKNPDALCTDVHNSEGVVFSPNTSITLDFGKNIAGTVRFDVRAVSGEDEYVGFTFTESSMWISPYHCDSGTSATYDSPQWYRIPKKGRYAADKSRQRGGFRYLSIWHNSTGTLTLGDLSVNFTAAPEMKSLREYQGYFNSNNEKLNRVWYAGAYTNQLCTADPSTGNALGVSGTDWHYNGQIASKKRRPMSDCILTSSQMALRFSWTGRSAIASSGQATSSSRAHPCLCPPTALTA